jgi:orotate phosphoribosyltransferase
MASLSLADLSACGAHQKGHFRLSSDMHSSDYLQCAVFLANPRRSGQAGQMLANLIRAHMVKPAAIISPAIGGIIIGYETARTLGVPFMFTERDSKGRMALRRGFAISANKGIVVVEDVVTTGGSTREVTKIAEGLGVHVVGVASIVNRSGQQNPFDPIPYRALIEADLPLWKPDQCPLCRQGASLSRPGSKPVA